MIQEFLKNLFSKIDPNDSVRVGVLKFLLFIAILTIPTGFFCFVCSNFSVDNQHLYPYADVDRFSKQADSLRHEYKVLYEDIRECALERLSLGTYTPKDYVHDVNTVFALDDIYRNVSMTMSYSFYFSQDLRVSYPDFFVGRNSRSNEFAIAAKEVEEAKNARGYSPKDLFSWKPFLLWLLKWYLGSLPFAFLICCILGWQERILFSFRNPLSSLLYLLLWPINFFVRIRRRVLDVDREARIRMSKKGLFAKLSEKEKQFLKTPNSSAYREILERIQDIPRFNVRYIFALIVVVARLSGFASEVVIYEKMNQQLSEISVSIEPPDSCFDMSDGRYISHPWFDNWNLSLGDFVEKLEKKKTSLYKLLLLSGYIQEIFKVPLGMNANVTKQMYSSKYYLSNEKKSNGDFICVRLCLW